MTKPNDNDPILTTREAAQLLGIAVSTAQLWMESGALPTWKTPGGHRRVRLSSVRRLLDLQSSEAAALAADADPASSAHTGSHTGPAELPGEARRLAALAESGLMDTPAEEVFDRLVRLAAQVTDCPIALVSFLDERRQWFKARIGIDLAETPREWAFCSHVLEAGAVMMVADTADDPRFVHNPLVTGAPHARFYAGVPLSDAHGRQLGTLCVLDREPRRLRERELRALHELAAIASDEIARRNQS